MDTPGKIRTYTVLWRCAPRDSRCHGLVLPIALRGRKDSESHFKTGVPETGFEPARPWSGESNSPASSNSATRAPSAADPTSGANFLSPRQETICRSRCDIDPPSFHGPERIGYRSAIPFSLLLIPLDPRLVENSLLQIPEPLEPA